MNIRSDCRHFYVNRLASNNNLSKSESDQEDNDDLNDNDWSYGAEKKGGWLKYENYSQELKIYFHVVNTRLLFMFQPRRENQIRLFVLYSFQIDLDSYYFLHSKSSN